MRDVSRVLVVDDSKASRLMMTKVIEASRFTTELTVVDSGEAALRLLNEEPCDVVFLDYAMPGIDGLETACLVQDQMPEVRVVMVSASRNPAVEKAARISAQCISSRSRSSPARSIRRCTLPSTCR